MKRVLVAIACLIISSAVFAKDNDLMKVNGLDFLQNNGIYGKTNVGKVGFGQNPFSKESSFVSPVAAFSVSSENDLTGGGGYFIFSSSPVGGYFGLDFCGAPIVWDYVGTIKTPGTNTVKPSSSSSSSSYSTTYTMGSVVQTSRSYFEMSGGFTFAIRPVFSVLVGLGFSFYDDYCYGNVYKVKSGVEEKYKTGWVKIGESDENVNTTFQLGVNLVLSVVDIGAIYTFRLGDEKYPMQFMLLAGIAF